MVPVAATKDGEGLCVMFRDVRERTRIVQVMGIVMERIMNVPAMMGGPEKVRIILSCQLRSCSRFSRS